MTYTQELEKALAHVRGVDYRDYQGCCEEALKIVIEAARKYLEELT